MAVDVKELLNIEVEEGTNDDGRTRGQRSIICEATSDGLNVVITKRMSSEVQRAIFSVTTREFRLTRSTILKDGSEGSVRAALMMKSDFATFMHSLRSSGEIRLSGCRYMTRVDPRCCDALCEVLISQKFYDIVSIGAEGIIATESSYGKTIDATAVNTLNFYHGHLPLLTRIAKDYPDWFSTRNARKTEALCAIESHFGFDAALTWLKDAYMSPVFIKAPYRNGIGREILDAFEIVSGKYGMKALSGYVQNNLAREGVMQFDLHVSTMYERAGTVSAAYASFINLQVYHFGKLTDPFPNSFYKAANRLFVISGNYKRMKDNKYGMDFENDLKSIMSDVPKISEHDGCSIIIPRTLDSFSECCYDAGVDYADAQDAVKSGKILLFMKTGKLYIFAELTKDGTIVKSRCGNSSAPIREELLDGIGTWYVSKAPRSKDVDVPE